MSDLARSDTVLLRNLVPGDLAAFQAYRHDPAVARFQSWTAMTDAQAQAFLISMVDQQPLRAGHWTQIAIADPVTGALMGDMGLHLSEDGATVETGITLARAHQRQGHALAAMRLAIALVWAHPGTQTIRAWADRRNTASVALCHRVGFSHLGIETNDDVVEEAFVLHRPTPG